MNPTPEDYRTAREVLEFELEKTQREEPYAENYIAACQTLVEELPGSAEG